MRTMDSSPELPNETSPLLQPDLDQLDSGETSPRPKTTDKWWHRNAGSLRVAFFAAWVIGWDSGYIMNVNTTYIGRDMNDMEQGVLLILLPQIPSALVPPFLPLLRRHCRWRLSMQIAAGSVALGSFGSLLAGSLCSIWLLSGALCISAIGVGLLNMLMLLVIREVAKDDEEFSYYRAWYMASMTLGMAFGALVGTALIELFRPVVLPERGEPWQIPFLVEGGFALILLTIMWWFVDERRLEADAPPLERVSPTANALSRIMQGDKVGTALIAVFTIIPIGLCGLFVTWGIKNIYFAIALPLEVVIAICLFFWLKGPQSLYSTKVLCSKPVVFAVVARAALSAVAQTLLYRLPLYAKIGNMLKSGPSGKGSHLKLRSGRQPCGGNVVVHSPDFMQNVVLPIYYAGEFCGEFAANRGIRLLGHESIVLELSLWIYFGVGQLIGNGTTGRSSRANWGWLALGSMLVTLLGGIANGSADNCISTFLFAAVDREARPAAEALSSLISNIVGPAALAFASLRYKALLENDLGHRYDNGTEIAREVLDDIDAVDHYPSDQRNVILRYAREGTERNIREVDFALILGIVAVFVLCWKHLFELITKARRWVPQFGQQGHSYDTVTGVGHTSP